MKYKDHESQRWLGTQNHTNYLMKCLKLTSIKRFGKNVTFWHLVRIYSRTIIFLSTRSLIKWYLIPYYQKVLPQIPRCQPFPTSQTHPQKPLSCYMFDHASTSYSQYFPPLESFEHLHTSTNHVWKIKNHVGTNLDGTRRHVSSAKAALNW